MARNVFTLIDELAKAYRDEREALERQALLREEIKWSMDDPRDVDAVLYVTEEMFKGRIEPKTTQEWLESQYPQITAVSS